MQKAYFRHLSVDLCRLFSNLEFKIFLICETFNVVWVLSSMKQDSVLKFATTKELIALVDSVEGKILFSLAQGDRADNLRLKKSHREATSAFTEELKMLLHCLHARAETDIDAAIFLAEIEAGEHEFQVAS